MSHPSARRARDAAALASFFARLAVKEHLAPGLHVRPLVAELFLTDNCNLRCVSCACWRSTTTGELDTDEWKDVLRQLRDLKIQKVNFTGGEALIRRDAIDLFGYASGLGFRTLHLNTNGLLMTSRKLDEVLAAGVRSFNVSVDGLAAGHDRIRGRRGAFARTTRNLEELLLRRKRHRLKVRMNFTVLRSNLDDLCDVMRLAQRLGVQLYLNLASDQTFLFRDEQVTRESRIAGAELQRVLADVESLLRQDARFMPRYADLRYIPGHFSDIVQRDLPCAESQLKLMVHSTGEVGGCWGHDPHLNVRAMPLGEIVDGREYRAEHTRLFRKQCVGCGSNYSLNLRWRPSSYVGDLLWRMRLARLGA